MFGMLERIPDQAVWTDFESSAKFNLWNLEARLRLALPSWSCEARTIPSRQVDRSRNWLPAKPPWDS